MMEDVLNCRATEPGFAGDIGAIKGWLVDWLIDWNEIKKRIGIAKTAFSKMKDVLKSTKIPLNTRNRILQCYIWSTLLYGAETWTITKVMKTRIEAFELWAYRRMLKISWTQKVTNKEVLSRMKMKKRLLTIIQLRKLKYFGHINWLWWSKV